MIPNDQYNMFLIIWGHFGPIWTLWNHFRQHLIFGFGQEALCVFWAKTQVLCEMIKKGPNDPKMAPNGQKHVILIIWDHFGPSSTTFGHRQACHVWPFLAQNGPYLGNPQS